MGIMDEDVVRVREAADIVAVVSGHTQLKKVGSRWSGLCPFHTEKSPSFSVNAADGLYYCFGCRASGDVITFVREMEHLDFVGAVEWLAGKSGITLRYTERDEGESRKKLTRLHETMAKAVEWYHERLKTGPDAAAARRYLRSRGFDAELVGRFQIGWAPDGWDEMLTALKIPVAVAEECGLGFLNRRNRPQDFFRNRILFPIFDDQGRPVAFGGRKLPDAEGPKYQNSRENTLYHKSRTLYALNWAKADIVASAEAIVCEGYTDVIGFHRAGIPRAVATCGTALTEDHLRALKRFTSRIVIAYDADEAGQAAAERVYEWERRLDLEVFVLSLPAGTDPDELARTDPEALALAVKEAVSFLGFRVDRVLHAANLATPEGRARAATAAVDVVREHPDPLVRDQYLMTIASSCRVEPERLREQLAQPARPKAPDPSQRRQAREVESDDPGPGFGGAGPGGAVARVREDSETEAIRLVLQHGLTIPLIQPLLFREGVPRRALEALVDAGGDLHLAIDDSDPGVVDLLTRSSVSESTADVDDVIVQLVDGAARRALRRLESDARTAEDPLSYSAVIGWLKLRSEDLRGDHPSMEAAEELVGWLNQHSGELR